MPTPNSVPDPAELLGRVEAARFAHVSVSWLDRATQAGKIPSYKYAGRVRYNRDDLRSLIASAYRPGSGD